MAIIQDKNPHRNRVQFTISRLLHEQHQRCLELAGRLGVVIDFRRDFERWFRPQLEQVERDLNQLTAERQAVATIESTTASAKSTEVADGNIN
jgi:hypothetical protein